MFPFKDFYERFNFLSLTLRDSDCLLCFPLKFCARAARIVPWRMLAVPFGKVSILDADQLTQKLVMTNTTLQQSAFVSLPISFLYHFFIVSLPVDESNQGSERFLVESHCKPFQRFNVMNCFSFRLPLGGIVSRTGRTQFISRLALAAHSYGELIDNRRCKDDLGYVFLGCTKNSRSSLYCCRVVKVGLVVSTCKDIIRES